MNEEQCISLACHAESGPQGELTEKGQHEDAVVAHAELVRLAELVPGGEVIVLLHTKPTAQRQRKTLQYAR